MHTMSADWPTPSPRVRDLFRQGAEMILASQNLWVEELHAASFSGARMSAIADDPVLAEGTRRTNIANTTRWASFNVASPGERVPVEITAPILGAARDLVRRGLDEAALDAFRTSQAVAWRWWMAVCFELTDDPHELRELLEVSSRSISTYIDDIVTTMSVQMRTERDELTRGTHARRRETAALLLEGAPIPTARAEERLGYRLTGPHTAYVVWSESADNAADVDAVADAITAAAGSAGRLAVVAGATTRWMWLPTERAAAPDLSTHPDVRVTAGSPGHDVDGFRSSHFQALAAQRLLGRLRSPQRFVRHDDVRLVSLLTADPKTADPKAVDEFVADTLGGIADASPEMRTTLRTWIALQCNTSQTAERLFTHRNTVIRRLARAEELLPRPLADNLVDVAAALEILRWRGDG